MRHTVTKLLTYLSFYYGAPSSINKLLNAGTYLGPKMTQFARKIIFLFGYHLGIVLPSMADGAPFNRVEN